METDTRTFTEGYFTPGASPELVARVRRAMRGVKYDTLVGRGMSGSLVIPELAKKLRKHWVIVRKPGENSHGSNRAIGTLGKRWVFADDFVASGATRRAVKDTVREITASRYIGLNGLTTAAFDTEYVGTLQYHNGFGTATPEWEAAR